VILFVLACPEARRRVLAGSDGLRPRFQPVGQGSAPRRECWNVGVMAAPPPQPRVYPAFLTDYLLHRRMRLSLLRYARSVSSKYLASASPGFASAKPGYAQAVPGTSVASLAYTASSPASRREPVRNAGYPDSLRVLRCAAFDFAQERQDELGGAISPAGWGCFVSPRRRLRRTSQPMASSQ
jgi:hypothetical protein